MMIEVRATTNVKRKRKRRTTKTTMLSTSSYSSLGTLLLLVIFSTILLFHNNNNPVLLFVSAIIKCTPNSEDPKVGDKLCEEKYRKGSYCTSNGICSNPFRKGCLQAVLPQNFTNKLRTCNSDDVDLTFCRPSEFEYEEVRILAQDWHSAMFSSWVMQIVLSELLHVPTTIETQNESSFNFYDPELRFLGLKKSYDYDALHTALEHGDCKSFQENRIQRGEKYKSCAHVLPEAWSGQNDNIAKLEREGIIEPATGSGPIVKYSWYLPRFTAERNPYLLSYFGLTMKNMDKRCWEEVVVETGTGMTYNNSTNTATIMDILDGDEEAIKTRRLLADTFLRPMNWTDFCRFVSTDNCTTPYYDDEQRLIASSAPPQLNDDTADDTNDDAGGGGGDGHKYFVSGLYHGHFAPTDDNDCDTNPTTCTGHIANIPCSWSTFVVPQAHYNQIPVKSSGTDDASGGYSYAHLVQIYNAANYTKSDVLCYWDTPNELVEAYLGTDAEFQRVLLPPATEECTHARVSVDQRCSADPITRIGSEVGSCDGEAHSVQRLIVSDMRSRYYEESITKAMRSPAYDGIKNIKFSDLWLAAIFRKWVERDIDEWNYDPREAVCTWVGENIEILLRFVPRTYPRSTRYKHYSDQTMLHVALVVAVLCSILTIVVARLTYRYRTKKVMLYAQPNFLYIIVAGLFAECLSAILYATASSNGTCMARHWFVLLGSSLQLIPLIVKIAAINKIFRGAIKFRRVRIQPRRLFMTVAIFIGVVLLYLLVWTIVDPSKVETISTLTDDFNEEQEQVVEINYSCASNYPAWLAISYFYQFFLLSAATILAFQSYKVKQEFNESSRLAYVIYAQFLVLLLRAIIWIFQAQIKACDANAIISLLLSVDVIMTICIYFVPKLRNGMKPQEDYKDMEDSKICKVGSVEQIRLDAAKELQDWERRMELLDAAKEELKEMESSRDLASLEFSCPSCSCPSCKQRILLRDGSLPLLPLGKEGSKRDNGKFHVDEQDSIEEESSLIVMKR